jgi:hypothetical protein
MTVQTTALLGRRVSRKGGLSFVVGQDVATKGSNEAVCSNLRLDLGR